MNTDDNATASAILIFRNEGGLWIFKGDAGSMDIEILPTDKVGFNFPDEDNADLDGYDTAAEFGIA